MTKIQDQTLDARSRIVESANRLGVQLNEQELERWMNSITEATGDSDIVVEQRHRCFWAQSHHVGF